MKFEGKGDKHQIINLDYGINIGRINSGWTHGAHRKDLKVWRNRTSNTFSKQKPFKTIYLPFLSSHFHETNDERLRRRFSFRISSGINTPVGMFNSPRRCFKCSLNISLFNPLDPVCIVKNRPVRSFVINHDTSFKNLILSIETMSFSCA